LVKISLILGMSLAFNCRLYLRSPVVHMILVLIYCVTRQKEELEIQKRLLEEQSRLEEEKKRREEKLEALR